MRKSLKKSSHKTFKVLDNNSRVLGNLELRHTQRSLGDFGESMVPMINEEIENLEAVA